MLILTRKLNESFFVGENAEVKIIRIGKNKVKVGVSAPINTPVYRKEIAPFFRNNKKQSMKHNRKQLVCVI